MTEKKTPELLRVEETTARALKFVEQLKAEGISGPDMILIAASAIGHLIAGRAYDVKHLADGVATALDIITTETKLAYMTKSGFKIEPRTTEH